MPRECAGRGRHGPVAGRIGAFKSRLGDTLPLPLPNVESTRPDNRTSRFGVGESRRLEGSAKVGRPALKQSAPKKLFQRRERVRRPASSCKKVPCLSWMRIASAFVRNGAKAGGKTEPTRWLSKVGRIYQNSERLSRGVPIQNGRFGLCGGPDIPPDELFVVKTPAFQAYFMMKYA